MRTVRLARAKLCRHQPALVQTGTLASAATACLPARPPKHLPRQRQQRRQVLIHERAAPGILDRRQARQQPQQLRAGRGRRGGGRSTGWGSQRSGKLSCAQPAAGAGPLRQHPPHPALH